MAIEETKGSGVDVMTNKANEVVSREPLADVRLCCGRHVLFVADIAVAMEGDKCRTSSIPEEHLPPIPAEELEHAMIGDKRAKDVPIGVVRFFRGDNWTPAMLEWVAAKINQTSDTGKMP